MIFNFLSLDGILYVKIIYEINEIKLMADKNKCINCHFINSSNNNQEKIKIPYVGLFLW